MTKQEEIREQTVEALCERNGWDYKPANGDALLAYEEVDFIFAFLHSKGVVLQVPNDFCMVIEPLVVEEGT